MIDEKKTVRLASKEKISMDRQAKQKRSMQDHRGDMVDPRSPKILRSGESIVLYWRLKRRRMNEKYTSRMFEKKEKNQEDDERIAKLVE